jgi:Na+-transporting methylmalonyl-CoA/oxaloacetate decarboxylase gamma subunit
MREIIVVAGFLSLLFLLFWVVVLCLESFVKRGRTQKEEKKSIKRESESPGEVIPVIVASIVAYESRSVGRVREKRVLYEEKKEKPSLWRTGGRNRY